VAVLFGVRPFLFCGEFALTRMASGPTLRIMHADTPESEPVVVYGFATLTAVTNPDATDEEQN